MTYKKFKFPIDNEYCYINLIDNRYVAYDNEHYDMYINGKFEEKWQCLKNNKTLSSNIMYALFGILE